MFKPGWKTTEFAFTVLFAVLMLLGTLAGNLKDPTMAAVATAVVGAAYAIARGMAKKNGVDDTKLPEIKK